MKAVPVPKRRRRKALGSQSSELHVWRSGDFRVNSSTIRVLPDLHLPRSIPLRGIELSVIRYPWIMDN